MIETPGWGIDIVSEHDDTQNDDRDAAACLRRLAEPTGVVDAAKALRSIEMDAIGRYSPVTKERATREEEISRQIADLIPALATLTNDVDRLIPAWISRLREQLETMQKNQQRLSNAMSAREDLPKIDLGNIVAVGQLKKVLQAVRERIDPHIGPIVDALGTLDRESDEDLLAVLEHTGPAIAAAVPKLLELLRKRGITRWPSHMARALANASRFDEGVVVALGDLLSSEEDHARHAAIDVLGTIGTAARSVAGQLLALRNGSEAERCGMIHALSTQGAPTPEFLGILEAAMHDENGYVCRAAAHAIGKLAPDPVRFVPSLIAACDWPGYLHDESLPEAAVTALGKYGTERTAPCLGFAYSSTVRSRAELLAPLLFRRRSNAF